jgi:hypothetical protein
MLLCKISVPGEIVAVGQGQEGAKLSSPPITTSPPLWLSCRSYRSYNIHSFLHVLELRDPSRQHLLKLRGNYHHCSRGRSYHAECHHHLLNKRTTSYSTFGVSSVNERNLSSGVRKHRILAMAWQRSGRYTQSSNKLCLDVSNVRHAVLEGVSVRN